MRTFLSLVFVVGCGTSEPELTFPAFPEFEALDTSADPSCTEAWVAGVRGRVVDEAGEPVPTSLPQMCVRQSDGVFACLVPEVAQEDGYFGRVVTEESRCMEELNFRVFTMAEGYATTYCRSTLDPSEGILTVDEPLVLYESTLAELPPEGDAEEARTVVIGDGLEIDVTPAPLFGLYPQIGGRRVDEPTCFADDSFDGLYALTPEARTFRSTDETPGFPVRIPTTLPEGTTVDLFVLGGLDELELATGVVLKEGAFEVFGTGTVVGGMVVNDPGSELPYLSWLGFRRR